MAHISNLTVTEFRDIVDDFKSARNWGSPGIAAGIILWLTQRDRRFLPVKAIAYTWALSEPAFKKELKTYEILTTTHDRIGTPHTLDATSLDPKSLEWLLECYENAAEDKRGIRDRANKAAPTLLKEIDSMRKAKTHQLEMALSSIEGTTLEACVEELTAAGIGFKVVLGAGKEKWMQKVSKSIEQHGTKNALHRYFKIPEGETIPLTLLKRTLKKPDISSKTRHRILFALNARKAKHGKKATAVTTVIASNIEFSVKHDGKPVPTDWYRWNAEKKTFTTQRNGLAIDFKGMSNVSFDIGSKCRVIAGDKCTFHTGTDCTITSGHSCTFRTASRCSFETGSNCTFDTTNECDFDTGSKCTFNTGASCHFDTGSNCRFRASAKCTFLTKNNCTFVVSDECDFITGAGCTFQAINDCEFTTLGDCKFTVLGTGCTLISRLFKKRRFELENGKTWLFTKDARLEPVK